MTFRNSESDPNIDKRFVLTGKALSVSTPAIMGVLNVTPDSFSDGGSFNTVEQACVRINEMVEEGASIIDIGGESTRPGSDTVPEQVELERVVPVIKQAVREFPDVMFSVDTTKYNVARQALENGVQMVNDVSGLRTSPGLADLCAEHDAALVIMHSRGTPKTMQNQPEYEDVVGEVLQFLKEKVQWAKNRGVREIVIDPGIGFGKTLEHNLELIRHLATFTGTGYPLLMGVSRKSVIGKILADEKGPRPVDNRLAGSLALQYHALIHGAAILRVHDVRQAKDILMIYRAVTGLSS